MFSRCMYQLLTGSDNESQNYESGLFTIVVDENKKTILVKLVPIGLKIGFVVSELVL